MGTYDRRFYDLLSDTAIPSAQAVVPMLLDLVPVRSAVDIGCGNGAWLSVLQTYGVEEILGLDGDWVATDQLLIPVERFERRKLDRPLGIERRFDLAVNLEVAEHLPPARAEGFVRELTSLAPVVLFSAAVPGQGGLNHVNEQWPAYWVDLFARHGYRALDPFRLAVWDRPDVTWWYKQNLLLFADESAVAANSGLRAAADSAPAVPPALVHPERFGEEVRKAQPGLGRWLRMAPAAFRRSRSKRSG